MKYMELKHKLKDFLVFSLKDIRKIEPGFYRTRLSEWQKKGYIKKIISEYYVFSDLEVSENALFCIANKIYAPSYISFESALSYYNLIPEGVYQIISTTSKKTNNFSTSFGEFAYHSIKEDLMFGYKFVKFQNRIFKIAEIEKALLDYFYINTGIKTEHDFYELRINKDEFIKSFNEDKLRRYLNLFKNKALSMRINNFLNFIKYD